MPVALSLVRTTLADPRFHETTPENQLRYRDTILIPALLKDPQFLELPPDQQQGFVDREINQKMHPLTTSLEQVTQDAPVPDEGPGCERFADGMSDIYGGPITVGKDLQRFIIE